MTVDEDWRYPRANLQNNGATSNAGPTGKLEKRWETSLDGAIYTGVNPTLANGRLFVGTKKGVAYALDAATGTEIWSNKVGNGILHPGPVVDGSVYFNAGPFISVNAETGEKEWQYSMNVQHVGTPLPVEGHVYCMGATGELHVLDAGSGKRLWKHPLGSVQDFLAYKDGVLFASLPKKIIAIDTDSEDQLWSATLPGETNNGPAVRDGLVYGEGDTIYKFKFKSGQAKGAINIQTPKTTPSVSTKYVASLILDGYANGIKVVIENGDTWSVELHDQYDISISGEVIYAGSNGGDLRIYNPSKGLVEFSTDMFSSVHGNPVVASNLIFVSDDERVVCLQKTQ